MPTTRIVSQLAVDDPLIQDANYRFDSADRQYIDEQIRGVESHLVNCIIKGKQATYFRVDTASVALIAGDVVCVYGTLAGEITVGKATGTYITTAGSAVGVVLVAAAPGSLALVAFTGMLSNTVTGLPTGSAGYGVLNTTTGRLDYSATLGTYTLGKVDPTGSILIYQVPAAGGGGYTPPTGTGIPHIVAGVQQTAASLIVNADVSATAAIASSKLAPPGTNGQFVWNNASAFAGTAITYDAFNGGMVVPSTNGYISITSGFLSLGSSVPTLGDIRLKNLGTIYARGPAGENAMLLRYGVGGSYVLELGESALVGEVRSTVTASGGTITGYVGSTNAYSFGSSVTLSATNNMSQTTGLNWSVACGNNATLAAAGTVYFNAANTAYLTLDSSTGTVALSKAATGSGTSPFKWGKATVAGAPTSKTATAAEYTNPVIRVTDGTAATTWKLILPLVDGAEWTVVNGGTFTVNVGGATGNAVAIAANTASKVVCHDGANFIKTT